MALFLLAFNRDSPADFVVDGITHALVAAADGDVAAARAAAAALDSRMPPAYWVEANVQEISFAGTYDGTLMGRSNTEFGIISGGGGSGADLITYAASITPDLTESLHKRMTAVNATAAEWTLNAPVGTAANFFIEVTNDGAITLALGTGVVISSGTYDSTDGATNMLSCVWNGFNLIVNIVPGVLPEATGDPFFSLVQVLMHFDADITTEVTGKTVNLSSGTPTHDTGVSQFGAGSMDVDGGVTSGEGVSVLEDVAGDFNLDGEWTIEG